MHNRLVICCDMDDTIEYLVKAWVKWLNYTHFLNVDYKNITDWEMKLSFPTLTEDEIFEPLRTPSFWDTVEPIPDAAKYMQMLIDEGYDFYICTNTSYNIANEKFNRCLFKHFPFLDRKKIIMTSNKQMIKCDILIDDALQNIQGDYKGILMTAPHNKDFNVSSVDNVFRAYTWEDVYNIVHAIDEMKTFENFSSYVDYVRSNRKENSIIRGKQ